MGLGVLMLDSLGLAITGLRTMSLGLGTFVFLLALPTTAGMGRTSSGLDDDVDAADSAAAAATEEAAAADIAAAAAATVTVAAAAVPCSSSIIAPTASSLSIVSSTSMIMLSPPPTAGPPPLVPASAAASAVGATAGAPGVLLLGGTIGNLPCGPCGIVPVPLASVPVVADGVGTAEVGFDLLDPALVGGRLIAQFTIAAPGGCGAILSFSNGLDITIE